VFAIRSPGPNDERTNRVRILRKAYRDLYSDTSNEKRMETMSKKQIEQKIEQDIKQTGGIFYSLRFEAEKERTFWLNIYEKETDEHVKKLAKKRFKYYETYLKILKEKEGKTQ
jgi:hypothetical protein